MFHKQIRITLVIAISTVFVMIIKYFKLPYIESKSKISLDDSFKYSNKMTKISSKWIVVTSINEPTLQIKNLARIKNFQLLVVGDKKSKNNWHCNNTIYLSLSKQIDLNFRANNNVNNNFEDMIVKPTQVNKIDFYFVFHAREDHR